MVIPGWTLSESPFHAGELAIQARVGVQDKIDKQGRRVIREFLPDQHREFFAQLPYVIVGTVDAFGFPWASIMVGEPGFIWSPDDRTLRVDTKPLFGDPLGANLAEGIDIGFLGIELHTRRRNRVNGVVTKIDEKGFEVQIKQSFGNCPQYIQARTATMKEFNPTAVKPLYPIETLGEIERGLITLSDTFFIATAYQDKSAEAASGVDVSHRGGKPGFVQIESNRILNIPDFPGNNHFNTFGNLELNPRGGLLFPDFTRGNLLYLTGKAEVIWSETERLLRFYLEYGYRVDQSFPWSWSEPEFI
ncbi:pyridoxamine 5'-phosphate oxidase family protein [Gloeocapsa sp. PCC 73106]|uniref:pyridoxamine 5'-phosphate oxidase family protein n=1 Tax=Gloeocapsa sp. PCC 73106 TaxID=102232 RepID=UPI0002ACF46D|nr:pyridoxamine 5'-phosphate oxidase family protein [Gloeocapsa sp. PCC 73106]ELR97375.1 pyridoxamine 5'-phosphate oxidase-related, FMN binding protein [Gloeocapsa sp. PCC 73106]